MLMIIKQKNIFLRAQLKPDTEGLTIISIYAYSNFTSICRFGESYFLENSFVHIKTALAEIFRETASLWSIKGRTGSFQQGQFASLASVRWIRAAWSLLPLSLPSKVTSKQTQAAHLKTSFKLNKYGVAFHQQYKFFLFFWTKGSLLGLLLYLCWKL